MTPLRSAVAAFSCLAVAATVRAATVTELPQLPAPVNPYPPAYTAAPRPVHINSAGDVVGTIVFTRKPCPRCPSQVVRRSFQVSNGVATQVGPDDFTIAMSNDLGEIVGNMYTLASGATYAYRVEGADLVPLDSLPNSVTDINNLGEISFGGIFNDQEIFTGLASDGEHGTHAFKWVGSLPLNDLSCSVPSTDYECMTGYTTGFDAVHDINDGATVADAMAVGEDRDNPWSSSYGQQHAFVGWRGVTTYLSSGFTAAALGVNDHGLIVGYDDGQAVLWMPSEFEPGTWSEHTVASLVDDPSWTFSSAVSVNDAGDVVGYGTHNGAPAMFRLSESLLDAGTPPATGMRFAAAPNPSRGAVRFSGSAAAAEGTRARITVMDAAGRKIAAIDAVVAGGRIAAAWDGLDASGRRPNAGVYFARIDAGAFHSRATVLLTR